MKSTLFLITLLSALCTNAQDFAAGEHFFTDHGSRVAYLDVTNEGQTIREFAIGTLEGETAFQGEGIWMPHKTESGELSTTGYYAIKALSIYKSNYELSKLSDSSFLLRGPLGDAERPARNVVYYLQSDEEDELAMPDPIGAPPVQEEIFHVPDSVASYPSGNVELMKWISQNVMYPPYALENDIHGNVYVQFVVEKDGSITQVKILRSPHEVLSEEVIRLMGKMPKWNPGMHRGVPVRSYMTLPIKFHLQ